MKKKIEKPLFKLFSITMFIVFASPFTGCATMKQNALLGTGIGVASGSLVGTLLSSKGHHTTGALIGATTGGLIGGSVGMFLYKDNAKVHGEVEAVEAFRKEEGTPSLTAPVVRKVWQPPRIEGDKYVTGHAVYILERGSVWSAQ